LGCAKTLADANFQLLDTEHYVSLQKNLKACSLWAGTKPVRVGTFFSGCELFCRQVAAIFSLMGSGGAGVELVFIADNKQWKRDFILENNAPKYAFSDVIDLHNNGWIGEDLLSGESMPVPACDIFGAGFECDTVSLYDTSCKLQKTEKQNCLRNAAGKTGTTGNATLYYIIDKRIKCSMLENNKLLGAENIRYIVNLLNSHGFIVMNKLVEADSHRSPSKRSRQYFWVFEVTSGVAIDQLQDGFEQPSWLDAISDCLSAMHCGAGDPSNFLLSNIHDERASEIMSSLAVARQTEYDAKVIAACQQPDSKKAKKEEDWPSVHLECYREVGLTWPPCIDRDDQELFGNVKHLPLRMQEVAYYHVHREREAPNDLDTYHDLMPNLSWKSEMKKVLMTVTCGGVIFDRRRKVVLWGGECLMMQGFDVSDVLQYCSKYTQGQLMELSGNAFNGFASMAVLVSMFAVYPWIESEVQMSSSSVPEMEDSDWDGCGEEAQEEEVAEEDEVVDPGSRNVHSDALVDICDQGILFGSSEEEDSPGFSLARSGGYSQKRQTRLKFLGYEKDE
jgi:site-specific DNA-cytosine methylase